MTLIRYRQKRAFSKTSEPKGKRGARKARLIFVVQKHHASHLHYDFRLEMEGVLRSWAIPKRPSQNTKVKRMAMMVEDHPYEYRNFEGRIPKGNYGAGSVAIWDSGTYTALQGDSKKDQEKHLLSGLRKGHITFILKGKKLKGEFALIRMRTANEKNAWLLIKARNVKTKKKDHDSKTK